MAEFDMNSLSVGDRYRLLIGAIVPRPIAWVSTVSKNGLSNLAPFSFFNGVCSNPPTLLFCPVAHPDGREKDTLRNIRETKEFVVNVATEDTIHQMNQTSANYPSNVSEFKEAGLTEAKSKKVKPPRVLESPISFECELMQIIPVGPGGAGSGNVVLGKIIYAHVADAVLDPKGRILVEKLKPVARLGGQNYCPVRDIVEIPRP